MISASERFSRGFVQRSKATRNTAMPASAVEARGRLRDAALAQAVGERGGERRQLDQLALLQLGVGGDDGLAPRANVAALLEHAPRPASRRGGDGLASAWPTSGARGDARRRAASWQARRAGEQHLALVGEVAEEGALGEPGPLGDLGDGGLLEAVLDVELQRRLREPAACVRLPSAHVAILVMTVADIACYGDDSN